MIRRLVSINIIDCLKRFCFVRPIKHMILSKDFIETEEGLVFAVVVSGVEQEKVLAFLRYVKQDGQWLKLNTAQANQLLKERYFSYLHYSKDLDAHLHAVSIDSISKHHHPRKRLQELIEADTLDLIEKDLLCLVDLLKQNNVDLSQIGVTGSILIGAQQPSSDIDLVCYSRATFHECRQITRQLIKENKLQELHEQDWQDSYDRRSCDLSYTEYVWHERRKYNKATINGRKFDLNFISDSESLHPISYEKICNIVLQCRVIDDEYTFDYPAVFKIDHHELDAVVCFTATYTGQAVKGELIEVSGQIERSSMGVKRIVVGSSREANGEYIKVICA